MTYSRRPMYSVWGHWQFCCIWGFGAEQSPSQQLMRNIKAESVAELCRMVDKLKLLPENSRRS